MDWIDFYENEVLSRLRPQDLFTDPSHDWKSQGGNRWKGSCPWHGSESGTCFSVDPGALQWHCFHCDRGGTPTEYVHALNGGQGTPKGKDFVQVVMTLAEKAGVSVPESGAGRQNESRDRRDLRPLRQPGEEPRAKQRKAPTRREPQAALPAGQEQPDRPELEVPEPKLREALHSYREALKASSRAKDYVEDRGLSAKILYDYGCGYAAPGQWIQDDVTNEKGTHIHRAPNGRIVTPHTTPGGQLVSLSGRAVPPCPEWLRKRNVTGNPTALFNAAAIEEGSGPLVLCEGPFDALSFIEPGWERAIALHNTDGVPWESIRGNADTLVFAFDQDEDSETGQTDALKRAREAIRRGYKAHTLHDEPTYEDYGDPNDALKAGALTLEYLKNLDGRESPGEDGGSEEQGASAKSNAPRANRFPTPQEHGLEDSEEEATPDDLIPHWNGDNIGYLGRWLWKRGGVPEGNVGAGLYADRALHKWIVEKLQASPHGMSEKTRTRLRWVLWRLYAAHGPEDVPKGQIPIPPMRRE